MFGGVMRQVFGAGDGESATGSGGPLAPRRPRIGLALGGGAARGWAAIGVVRALRAAGLEADVVAGTSMGAVVGACDLAGRLDGLEDFARGLTPRRVFALLDLKFGAGLVGGSRLAALLMERLGDLAIEDLPRPFTAVATELATGHEIRLGSGRLVDALRASYALPGVFEPVRIAGRLLVDGALVDPVPVSVCRALGADIVVAVNPAPEAGVGHGTVVHLTAIGEDEVAGGHPSGTRGGLFRRAFSTSRDHPGLVGVMMESFNIIQDRITRSRLAGDPPDLLISPRVGHIGLFDFHRAAEAIDLGRAAAERALPDVAAILDER